MKTKISTCGNRIAILTILIISLIFCSDTLAIDTPDLDSFKNCLSTTNEICRLSDDIVRNSNEEETVLLVDGDVLTIDLNGHKLQYPLNVQSKVLLTDSVGGGEIIVENRSGIELSQGSEAVIDGTKITSVNRAAIRVGGRAKLVVEDGEFIGKNAAISIGNPCSEEVLINGGTFVGGFSNSCSRKFEIKGGIFTGNNSSLYTYGNTVIDDGDFSGGLQITDGAKFVDSSGNAESGTFVINGGNFHSDDTYGIKISRHYNDEDEKYHDKYSVLINGGVFDGKKNGLWIECANGGNCIENDFLELRGGRFKGSMEASFSGNQGAIFLQTESSVLTINDFIASDYELFPSNLSWSDTMKESYGYYSYTDSDNVTVVKKNIDTNSGNSDIKAPNTGSNGRNEAEFTSVTSITGGILSTLIFVVMCKYCNNRLKSHIGFSKN